jgi:hypothetical protein
MIEKEELKRMEERPGFDEDGNVIQLTKRKKAKRVAQKVVGGVFKRTIGRVAGFASRRLLGKVPETALEGSFQEEKPLEDTPIPQVSAPEAAVKVVSESDKELLENEITTQIFAEYQSEKSSSMKSDSELIEELMTDKNEKQKSMDTSAV